MTELHATTPLPDDALARVLVYGAVEHDDDGLAISVQATQLQIAGGPANDQQEAWLPNLLRSLADEIERGGLLDFTPSDDSDEES